MDKKYWLEDVETIIEYLDYVSEKDPKPENHNIRVRQCKLSDFLYGLDIRNFKGDNLDVFMHIDEVIDFQYEYIPTLYLTLCKDGDYIMYEGTVSKPATFTNIVEELVKPIFIEGFDFHIVFNEDCYINGANCFENIAFSIFTRENECHILNKYKTREVLRGMLVEALNSGNLKVFNTRE